MHAQPLVDHHRHRGAVCPVDLLHAFCAEPVFPVLGPPGNSRRPQPAAERLDRGDAQGGRPLRGTDQGRSGPGALEYLHRPGRDPLLPASRSAVAEPLLRAVGDCQQGLRRASGHDGPPAEDPARRVRRRRHQRAIAGDGPACGPADSVSGQRCQHRRGTQTRHRAGHLARPEREHRRDDLRLERAG